MERSFEQIFLDSLVDALSKTAKDIMAGEGGEGGPGTRDPEAAMSEEQLKRQQARVSERDWKAKPFMEKMRHHYEGAKGQVKGLGSRIKEGWQGSGRLGKGLMIGAPAAAIGGTALTAAALTHALRGKKKSEE
jgi:hypothetical protein